MLAVPGTCVRVSLYECVISLVCAVRVHPVSDNVLNRLNKSYRVLEIVRVAFLERQEEQFYD
jgi:hypothetical protein